MNDLIATEIQDKTKIAPIHLSWMDNPSVQKLLDVVVSIIVEEYMQIAKQNPEAFLKKG